MPHKEQAKPSMAEILTNLHVEAFDALGHPQRFLVPLGQMNEALAQAEALIASERADARHWALENIGSIGADYHNSPNGDRLYRDAVTDYILKERHEWAAQLTPTEGDK